MKQRSYTLAEIDALRHAVRQEWLWGAHPRPEPEAYPDCHNEKGVRLLNYGRTSRPYNEAELDRTVEERVRTLMMAGITEPDFHKKIANVA